MGIVRIQSGQSEQLRVTALDINGAFVTGLSDVLLEIRRESDGFYFDFSDSTFKSSGWTTRQEILSELDSTNSPGVYFFTFSGFAENDYFLRATSVTAHNSPWEGEIKVGDFIDNLDGKISLSISDISAHRTAVESKIINILGLVQSNFLISSQVYDSNNNLLSATIKIYPTKADTDADTNVITSYNMTATYDANDNLVTYKVTEN